MPASTDRNLLFGILALQMDFITREQLIAGMQAWVLAKDRPLAEHLEGVGALASANRQLLEPLVAAHIRQHNDDPLQSLASVSSLGSVREELARFADRDVEASLACVREAKAQREPVDPLATMTVALNPASSGGRFRILRPHAEGGLGRVYVARDQELGREVALKEIKPEKSANPDNRSRFAREAEITGGLEHPGIVPVYGLGTYSDGRPYYAMRFIRGHSLKEAIEQFHRPPGQDAKPIGGTERNLQLRRLLQRLIDVCEAIDYAHSRGVLHRDLKPGNIMLGRYGETLVVDWGLAKALGKAAPSEPLPVASDEAIATQSSLPEPPLVPASEGSSEPTLYGSTIGTPAFMSPEQAAGRLDLIGAPSDVFSLGATLYQLLTGQPPYQGDDILGRARRADYPRPRSRKADIPRPLEAICLKAMAAVPGERYSSARAMAQDLERFLADEHVLAHDESATERLGRWSRRNRSWVRAGAAGLLMTCAVAVVAIVLISRALIDANEQKQKAEAQQIKAERLATDNMRIANEKTLLAEREKQQRTIAQQESEEKSALADFLVGTFQASDPVGLGGAAFFIAKSDTEKLTAAQILDRGAERVRTDPELVKRPLAQAGVMDAIGNVYRSLGDFSSATPLLVDALAIRRGVPASEADIADTCFHLGWVYHEQGDYPRARPLYEEALRIRRQSNDPAGIRLTAAMLRNYGWMLANQGDRESAEKILREAIAMSQPPDGQPSREVAFSKFALAFSMIDDGRRVPALAMALDARREWERSENNPQLSAAATAFVLGVVFRRVPGLVAHSETQLRKAIDLFAPIAGKDYYITGVMHFELARTFERLNRYDDAEREYEEGLRICRAGDWFQHPRTLFFAQDYSNLLADHDRLTDAKKIWNEFVMGQQRRFGENHAYYANAIREQARFLYGHDDFAAATPLLEQSVAICRRLEPPDRWLLGRALANLGYCRMDDGGKKWSMVEVELTEALPLLAAAQDVDPDEVAFYRTEALTALAEALGRQGKIEQAEETFQEARRASEGYRGFSNDRRALLREALYEHAWFLRRTNQPKQAAEVSLERKKLWRGSSNALFRIAGELAECVEMLAKLDALSSEQSALLAQTRADALSTLREAVEAGFRDKEAIASNARLKVLADDPQFQEILKELP